MLHEGPNSLLLKTGFPRPLDADPQRLVTQRRGLFGSVLLLGCGRLLYLDAQQLRVDATRALGRMGLWSA